MAWVRGIREVRHVHTPVDEEQVGLRRGPVVMKIERVITELPAETWGRLVHGSAALPQHTGAGPCGTRARCERRRLIPLFFDGELSALAWSIKHLVDPLAAYYATYVPPMRFGAKPGPRGRRVA